MAFERGFRLEPFLAGLALECGFVVGVGHGYETGASDFKPRPERPWLP